MRKDQIYYYILHLLSGISIGFFLFGCKSTKEGCDAYSLKWTKEADSLIVYKNHEIFIPQTPVNDVKQIHFNNIEKGKYTVNLLKSGEVIETKKLTVNR